MDPATKANSGRTRNGQDLDRIVVYTPGPGGLADGAQVVLGGLHEWTEQVVM